MSLLSGSISFVLLATIAVPTATKPTMQNGVIISIAHAKPTISFFEIRPTDASQLKKEDMEKIEKINKAIEENPSNIKNYVDRGTLYVMKGRLDHLLHDFDLAISDFDQALKFEPKNAAIFTLRGEAYAKKAHSGSIDWVRIDLHMTLSRDDKAAPRLNAQDLRALYDHAVEDFTQASALDPINPEIFEKRAAVYYTLEEFDQAIYDYDHILRLARNNGMILNKRGRVYAEKGDLNRAIADFSQAIEINPTQNADSYRERGKIYRQKNEDDLADADEDRFFSITGKELKMFVNRGFMYSQKNDTDRAIQAFTIAIDHDPTNVRALAGRCQAYRYIKMDDLAAQDRDRVLTNMPKLTEIVSDETNADERVERAELYEMIGQNAQALQDLDAAIRLDPENVFALTFRAYRYYKRGNQDQALDDLETASHLDPNNTDIYVMRARIYLAKGQADAAVLASDHALLLDSANERAYQLRGSAYLAKGQYDRALEDLQEAIQLKPKSSNAIHTRGKIHARQNDTKAALVDYTHAIQIEPTNSDFFKDRAALYRQLGQNDLAEADHREALRLEAQNPPE